MRAWWLLSVILVGLMLAILALAWPAAAGLSRSMTSVLQAVSVVFVDLLAIALVYFVVRRWKVRWQRCPKGRNLGATWGIAMVVGWVDHQRRRPIGEGTLSTVLLAVGFLLLVGGVVVLDGARRR